jgi:ankyrin repeat protein
MVPIETKAETVTTINESEQSSVFVSNHQSTKNPEWDCLLRACQKNDSATVRKILKEYPLSHSHANPMGQSALHIASFWVHVQCVEILLESGADVNAVNCFTGATPLHECIQSISIHQTKSKSTKDKGGKQYHHPQQRIECIKLLLQANAEPYALDAMKRTPIECFVLTNSDEYNDNDDIVATDRVKIEKILLQSKQTTKIRTSFKIILTKLSSSKDVLIKLDEIDTIWMEEISPRIMNNNNNNNVQNNEIDLKFSEQLSDKLLSIIQHWIDTITKSDDEIVNDYREYYLGRIAWIWKKIVEISTGITAINADEDDDNNNASPSLVAYSTQQNALNIFGMAILERYGSLHSKRQQQQQQQTSSDIINIESSSSLLQDDNILSSWTEAVIILMTEEEFSSNNKSNNNINGVGDEKNNSAIIQQQQQLQQAWMTIARRNYLQLAIFWWDQLNISPIGVVNRQGMTPLQFATRSGHFRLVRYFLLHPRCSSSVNNRDDDKNDKNNKNISLYDWVQHQDQRGQTALMAAIANQHKEIVQLLEDFIE